MLGPGSYLAPEGHHPAIDDQRLIDGREKAHGRKIDAREPPCYGDLFGHVR